MAQVSIVVEEVQDYWATWSHVFQGANTTWLFFDTRQLFGNFFIGLQAQTENAWNAQIPPGSTILSATMEFTGGATRTGLFGSAYTTTLSSPDRALQTQQQDPIQRPFEPFEGWRRDFWTNAEVVVLSTTFTTIASPAAGPANQSITIRQITAPGATIPNRDLIGQRITAAAGNTDIASITWTLRRSPASPAGNVRIRIQGITTDRGVTIPDGIDFAVSNPVAMSSLSTLGAGAGAVFTFPGLVSLVAGQQYFLVLDTDDYPANNLNWIQSRNHNAFFNNGQLYHYGEGLGFDWQNYPGNVDLNQAVVLAVQDIIPGGITWPVGNVFINQLETSPDISALIQAQIDMPNYTLDSGIILTLSRGSASALGRQGSSNLHATNPGPVLRVTYDEPVIIPPVVPTKMADPYVGRARFKEPLDIGYYRWRYGAKLEHERLVRETAAPTQILPDPEETKLSARLAEMQADQAETERDLLNLQVYITDLHRELESRHLQDIAEIARLEENRVAARDALLLVLRWQRRQRNQVAAVMAAIRFYF